jgi:hypothetical protein
MPTAELLFEQADAPSGAVVGAVEIVDDRLVTVAGTVLKAQHPVPVELPAGRYLAHGWLPSGEPVRATFEITGSPGGRPALLRRSTRRPAASSPSPADGGWALGWRYTGNAWLPDGRVRADRSPGAELELSLARGTGRSLALQVAAAGMA